MVAGNNNAICSVCGKSYHKCLSCRDSIKLQPWKVFTDTAEHYKIFQAVRGLSTGVYTKEEFKSKLENIDLSDLESYKEHIKVLIEDTLKKDKPVVEENTIEEELVIEKPINSRKRNYKINKEIEAE